MGQFSPDSGAPPSYGGVPDVIFSGDTSMRDTPEMSGDINARLKLETSEEESSDSVTTESSSELDDSLPAIARGLPVSRLPTGLCYDERMRYHAEVSATSGENVHPEDPRRIYYIYKELCEAGLVDDPKHPPMVTPLLRIDAREATREECLLVHTPEHYDFVKKTATLSDEELIDLSEAPEMDSIYFNQLSYFSSKLSAGAAIETCKAVFSRQVKNAIAVIRPPGHHAEVHRTMGFCLFNNVCIASRVCQSEFSDSCRKILIVDWDVHHGNGCQKAFYEDPNILYISLHVHMDGRFYPSGPEGDMYHCGNGPGVGKNVNIPWPSKGMGDGDYMYAFQHVVMPIATEFDPDFVIVASGFDAAAGDELGGCFVSPACYAHMTHMLMSLAGGKIAVCLEGGYNFTAISKSALAVTRTLMGEPPDRLIPSAATTSAIETVAQVRAVQSQHWRSIYPKGKSDEKEKPSGGIFGGERLHDIIRRWQAAHLYDNYKFTQLHIFRESVSKSFDHQVLATPNYETKRHLLIIFHDSPDLLGTTANVTTQQKIHDTWLVDGTQSYIQWAVAHNFGVIDINIPELISVTPDPSLPNLNPYEATEIEYASTATNQARKESEKLAAYLWENYVEPHEFPGYIFLMGAGHAFHAVAKLISDNESVYHSLAGVIGFISSEPLRPVYNPNNHSVTPWYGENSRIYVSHAHSLWRKTGHLSRKYGKLIQSRGTVLNQMMKLHENEVTSFMQEKVDIIDEEDDDDDDNDDDDGDDDTEDEDQDQGITGPPGLVGGDEQSAPSSQQQQVLAPVASFANVGVSGATAGVASSPELGDVFMSTEQ